MNLDGRVIRNADDLGLCPGINAAIFEAARGQAIDAASWIVTTPHSQEARALIDLAPGLAIGVHLDLTYGIANSPPEKIPLLAWPDGRFRHEFGGILGLSVTSPAALREQVRRELSAQIEAVARAVRPSHLDSHRHVHSIPLVNDVTHELAASYSIPRVRAFNERALTTLLAARLGFSLRGLWIYIVTRVLAVFHRGGTTAPYLFSLLAADCPLSECAAAVDRLRRKRDIEWVLHLGRPAYDRQTRFLRDGERVFSTRTTRERDLDWLLAHGREHVP
jgi:hypothetical protein